MKLEDSPASAMTPTNSSPKLLPKQQINNKLNRQSSTVSTIQRRNQYMAYQRRQNIAVTSNDFLNQHTPSKHTVPLLFGAMNEFFDATKIMEDEIMLPSRLKDMPVDEIVLDNSVQPNNWHELYTFVRDVRNQLTRSRPFIDEDDDDNNNNNNTPYARQETKDSNDDEGILLASHDNTQHSSTSSIVSSDELENSITSSTAASFDTIKDELKYHFFGLIGSLDNLKLMANRVTEKYREDSTFKI
ncbi:unnamed protein product [Adineta steineri]|uniref:Uncharacterized protein n=1 Tax=Adineta steineri TaxID=433720 RepID=A0A815ARG0_9BILA|nr:unnamed protein product [Adineta steineri]CAF1451738.1 unnamed protein product [Adineta steineri]CAF3564685.1 unnamed protein product [Adineta steineri]CAF3920166.1 unnamed protein product [Adineta steineri]